ncbi:Hypothetical predicted protein [Octopus vulgaris]|uniref:Uncharacterized protein n=1 Tax=Octopus vulgaris TaxID=6645 RepID=A0AA36AMI9_OCTVU|nr:Hypothetical predicted protein [Octopus vulgaris]
MLESCNVITVIVICFLIEPFTKRITIVHYHINLRTIPISRALIVVGGRFIWIASGDGAVHQAFTCPPTQRA